MPHGSSISSSSSDSNPRISVSAQSLFWSALFGDPPRAAIYKLCKSLPYPRTSVKIGKCLFSNFQDGYRIMFMHSREQLMKSLNMTVRHLRACLFKSKNFLASDWITCRNTVIHQLNVSLSASSTKLLSIPSAQLTHLKHINNIWRINSRPCTSISELVKAERRDYNMVLT